MTDITLADIHLLTMYKLDILLLFIIVISTIMAIYYYLLLSDFITSAQTASMHTNLHTNIHMDANEYVSELKLIYNNINTDNIANNTIRYYPN